MSAAAFTRHFASRPDLQRRVGDVRFAPNGCWLWPTARYIKVGPRGARQYLHRVSLELKLGRPLGALHALHSCDQPPCCNPGHLRPGSHAENMRDMSERGRVGNRVIWGVENNKATLTDEQIVEALRELDSGATITAVAARWGVTRRAVTTWRDGTARRSAHDVWLTGRDKPMRRATEADTPMPWEVRRGSRTGNDGKPMRLRVWTGGEE